MSDVPTIAYQPDKSNMQAFCQKRAFHVDDFSKVLGGGTVLLWRVE